MGAEDTKGKVGEEDLEEEEEIEETGNDSDEGEGKADKGKGGKSGAVEKTFSQAQVTRMMTREKNQGRAAALRELGIDPNDKKAISLVKALIDSQKSEEQKAAEKAAEEASKVSEAEQRAAIAEAKAEAMMAGIKKQYVEDAVALAMTKVSDEHTLKDIFAEFKTKYSIWFDDDAEDDDDDDKAKKDVGKKGTGSSIKTSKELSGKGKKDDNLGARLAAQRKATSSKKSFWS